MCSCFSFHSSLFYYLITFNSVHNEKRNALFEMQISFILHSVTPNSHLCVSQCVCVCVCVRESERERERGGGGERERERGRE